MESQEDVVKIKSSINETRGKNVQALVCNHLPACTTTQNTYHNSQKLITGCHKS